MSLTFYELTSNKILWIAIFAWFVAQLIKVLIALGKEKRIRPSLFLGTGGMPSSHTSFVTAMTTSIGFVEGFNSSIFAVSAILSLIVMSDAAGIRRAAGEQAKVINKIADALEHEGDLFDKELKELLGHTPVEVFGGLVLGITVAILMN